MKRIAYIIACVAICAPVWADTLVATRTVRAQAIITPEDISVIDADVVGGLSNPVDVIGKEARVVLYAGRPIRPGDIGPPALVERNQVVSIQFERGGLTISAEGRALGRGGVGDMIRVMNISSRTTISGVVMSNGSVRVSN
ncbi:flagellar basal body P-ring formation chaperone FlgA [Pseudaestuariivita rosea]|uniref:flagellar basal body P-ring formation chaperone FlgA n=1 Tax=Pseudaestuariivita rosea TaxID=2763263 RepID=UPI001ABAF632|nr:flagellar basal body P-ring formation chaperone FlgA [Pseudaestuariivita rosea]